MSAITQSYKIDMTSGAVPLRIKVSQYDAGIRTLTFALFNLGAKLTSAQLSSLTAYVQGTKQDKKGFEYECTADFSAEGCSVTVAITEQMTACAGDVVCELVLVANDDRIGSANFILEVERAALGADTDISETELPDIITAGRQYAAQAEDAAERAEEAAAGVDNYALAGAGMMTEYSAGVIDTNIYLHREPKIGDRLLIMFTQTFTQSTPIKIYKENGGTAYTLNFDLWDSDYVLKGLCLVEVVDFLDNFALRWLHSYSGTEYQAGQYIGISGNYINNIAPQLGDNSEYHEKNSAITDGNLGTYGYHAKYIIINFKARAVPNDTTGKYSLQLSKGATLEDASFVDRDGNDFTAPIKAGAILLCSVDSSNDIVMVLNNDIMANGEIQDGQGNTLSVLAEALTKTASGNPVVISDCAGGKARSLITEINAIQDLHGYDKPWVGGAGKNKAKPFTFAQKEKGITITPQTDGSVVLNGTKTTDNEPIRVSSSYTVLANTAQTCSIKKNTTDALPSGIVDYSIIGYGTNKTINPSEGVENSGIRVYINQGTTLNNVKIYPQIIIGSTAENFEPYANICPISGHTSVEIERSGKNLVKGVLHNTGINGDGVVFSGGTADNYAIAYCKVKAGETYTIKTSEDIFVYGLYNDVPVVGASSLVGRVVLSTKTFTPTIDAYLAYRMGNTYATPQVEVGTESTTYEAPQVVDVIIQLGQTVYGADINWDTGVMTVKNVLVDMGDLTWTYSSAYLNYIANIDDIKTGEYAVKPNMYCSCFEVMAQAALDNASYGITVAGGLQRILARDADITDATLFTTAMTGQKICYELATPIELTLTPTELQMLKGYNRVTIDNGSIEVGYIAKIA
jgi:hypothetical protein